MEKHKEPAPVAILSARIMRAYPSLSSYSAASLATELLAIERAQRRHAERCCSGEDGGYVRIRNRTPDRDGPLALQGPLGGRIAEHDPDAERKAGERIDKRIATWIRDVMVRGVPGPDRATHGQQPVVDLQGDPRGPALLLRLPGEAEAVAV